MAEKIAGYSILALGVVIIGASAVNAFQILTKAAQPVAFITLTGNNSNLPLTVNGATLNISSSTLLDSLGLSATTINFTLNLILHLFILGFIARMGFHLASIGTQLVRKIVVDIKSKEDTISEVR